jgi:hypothetical protein
MGRNREENAQRQGVCVVVEESLFYQNIYRLIGVLNLYPCTASRISHLLPLLRAPYLCPTVTALIAITFAAYAQIASISVVLL